MFRCAGGRPGKVEKKMKTIDDEIRNQLIAEIAIWQLSVDQLEALLEDRERTLQNHFERGRISDWHGCGASDDDMQ